MSYDLIQAQDYGGLKCAKMADFKVYQNINKKLMEMENYDTPRQFVKICDIHPHLASCDLQT